MLDDLEHWVRVLKVYRETLGNNTMISSSKELINDKIGGNIIQRFIINMLCNTMYA